MLETHQNDLDRILLWGRVVDTATELSFWIHIKITTRALTLILSRWISASQVSPVLGKLYDNLIYQRKISICSHKPGVKLFPPVSVELHQHLRNCSFRMMTEGHWAVTEYPAALNSLSQEAHPRTPAQHLQKHCNTLKNCERFGFAIIFVEIEPYNNVSSESWVFVINTLWLFSCKRDHPVSVLDMKEQNPHRSRAALMLNANSL